MKPVGFIGIPFSWLYGTAVGMRNLFFDMGLAKITRSPLPVLSVGNIAAGGTGKTPVTAFVCGVLSSHGLHTTIVSRGYGRKRSGAYLISDGSHLFAGPGEAGDEALLLARRFLGSSGGRVSVVVSERRTEGARIAHETLKADCIVLDDGFQHRWVARALDIVLIHARDLRKSRLVPAGNQREPLWSLRRAGIIGVTGSENAKEFARLKELMRVYSSASCIWIKKRPQSVMTMKGSSVDVPEILQGKKVVVTAAIARPESFISTLKESGAQIIGSRFFEDHHWYTPQDCHGIQELARRTGANLIVTTEKDAMRMEPIAGILSDAWRYLKIEAVILEGREEFERAIGDAVRI